jgi:uncharacterized protein
MPTEAAPPVVPPSLPGAPPLPTAAEQRHVAVDMVRGLAVLGILVMNVVEFGLPIRAYDNPAGGGGTQGADLWTWLVQSCLFDGKMRALFSMLFGAGLVLLTERAARSGRQGSEVDVWLRRCLWLVVFGLLHRFGLQWTGDILYAYGLLGLIAVAFRHVRPSRLLLLGLVFLGAFVPIEYRRFAQADAQRTLAAEATAAERAGQTPTTAQKDAKTRWERRLQPPADEAVKPELEAMRGGYSQVFAFRWDYHHQFQSAFLYYHFVWDVLGMMFLGMALQKWGFFAGACRPRAYVVVLLAGLVVAGAGFWWASTLAGRQWSAGELDLRLWRGVLHPFERGLVGLAWAAAFLLLLRAGRLRAVTASLARVGRMAFTNYVLQTVCCTLVFFGYGLGRYGSLSRSEHMLVWACVTAVQVVVSWGWLAVFRFGPLEWLWRCLTYGRWIRAFRASPPPHAAAPT